MIGNYKNRSIKAKKSKIDLIFFVVAQQNEFLSKLPQQPQNSKVSFQKR